MQIHSGQWRNVQSKIWTEVGTFFSQWHSEESFTVLPTIAKKNLGYIFPLIRFTQCDTNKQSQFWVRIFYINEIKNKVVWRIWRISFQCGDILHTKFDTPIFKWRLFWFNMQTLNWRIRFTQCDTNKQSQFWVRIFYIVIILC
jgi:hypothetical protein